MGDHEAITARLESVPGWSLVVNAEGLPSLCRDFWIPSYTGAVEFVQAISAEAERANHHPNLEITHHCQEGATVSVKLLTHAIPAISSFDFELARRVQDLYTPARAQA